MNSTLEGVTVNDMKLKQHIPDHCRPYEMAARIYCKKRATDPNLLVPQEHPTLANVVVGVPVWCIAAEEMIDLSMKLQSIKEANETSAIMVPQ